MQKYLYYYAYFLIGDIMFNLMKKNLAEMEEKEILKLSLRARSLAGMCEQLDKFLLLIVEGKKPKTKEQDKAIRKALIEILRVLHDGEKLAKQAMIDELKR